jgi:hypothetical protein
MSPKTQSVLIMCMSVVFGIAPNIPELANISGLMVPPWAKFVCAVVASIGAIVGFRLPAQKSLATSDDGKNSGGGPGVTLSGDPHPGLSKTPPVASFMALGAACLLLSVFLFACPPGTTPQTVTTDALSAEGFVCFVDELGDPLLPTGPAQTIASFIQNACQASIPQALTKLVATLVEAFENTPIPGEADAGPNVGISRLRARAHVRTK